MKAIESKRTEPAWWDAAYESNSAQGWSIWRDRRLAAFVAQYAALPLGARVFLPACGAAHCAISLAEVRPDLEWLLSDYSPAAVQAANVNCKAHNIRLAHDRAPQLGDIENPGAWSEAAYRMHCDAVILTEVLEHLADPFAIKPMLSDFARAIVTVPTADRYAGPATTFLFDSTDLVDLFNVPNRGATFISKDFDGFTVGISSVIFGK